MRTTTKLGTATLGSALLLTLGAGFAQAATATDGNTMATLRPVALNGVDASGTAMVTVNGTRIDVTMAASGLLPDSPHAAHIHFGADARHECPTAKDDAKDDGTINTTDGGPAYGPIVVSLTKTGDTSPDSGLAVDRLPGRATRGDGAAEGVHFGAVAHRRKFPCHVALPGTSQVARDLEQAAVCACKTLQDSFVKL